MSGRWADEIDDSQPLLILEPFYLLASVQLGDPDAYDWILNNAEAFHALYRNFRPLCEGVPVDSATVLIQYMIWYDRESRNLKEGKR